MKFRLIVLSLAALPVGAQAFDIDAYCKQASAAGGGGAQLEAACGEQERAARSEIERMIVAPHIMDYCQGVGQSAGGSYQFMEKCLKEEAKSGDKLK
jgi:hypothetical protein